MNAKKIYLEKKIYHGIVIISSNLDNYLDILVTVLAGTSKSFFACGEKKSIKTVNASVHFLLGFCF